MYIHVNDPRSSEYKLIDLISGATIPGVQEADDETGEFTVIMQDLVTGNYIVDELNNTIEFNFKGNIKIVPVKSGE